MAELDLDSPSEISFAPCQKIEWTNGATDGEVIWRDIKWIAGQTATDRQTIKIDNDRLRDELTRLQPDKRPNLLITDKTFSFT